MFDRVLARFAGPGLKVWLAAAVVLASATAASATSSDAQAAMSASPARISWFYKPPTDGTTSNQIAGRHSEVILTGRADLSFRDKLRAAGWRGRVWNYVEQPFTAAPLSGPCGAFGVWWDLWDNQAAWEHQAGVPGTNDFCRHINGNESWMLHKPSDGTRMTRRSGNQTQYYMNPAAPGWRQWFANRVKRDLATWSYDGVFLDDVWSNYSNHGSFREYATMGAYEQAVIGFIRHLKSQLPGVRVIGNTDDPAAYSDVLDGWLYESFAGWWMNRYQAESEILALWRQTERDASAGKDIFLIAQGERADTRKVRFSFAAYLMVAHPRVSFRYSHVNWYQQYWDYPEYRLALGQPVGTRRHVGGSTWRRDFQTGTAFVNLSANSSQTIHVGSNFRTQDGAAVSSVTVAPQTGVFLLRTYPSGTGTAGRTSRLSGR